MGEWSNLVNHDLIIMGYPAEGVLSEYANDCASPQELIDPQFVVAVLELKRQLMMN